jgi:hypothetical protein
VKSEPTMILSSSHHQEDVPSSVGSVSVAEFITSEVKRYKKIIILCFLLLYWHRK